MIVFEFGMAAGLAWRVRGFFVVVAPVLSCHVMVLLSASFDLFAPPQFS